MAGSDQVNSIIVVAEDSAPNRAILVHLLKKLGFDVREFENGEDAWKATQELATANTLPIAILSDIMMPKMDGVEFLKNVRAHETLGSVPFVLVTAVSDKDHVVKAKELQVNGYMVKPISFPRVLAKLKEIFPDRNFPSVAA